MKKTFAYLGAMLIILISVGLKAEARQEDRKSVV